MSVRAHLNIIYNANKNYRSILFIKGGTTKLWCQKERPSMLWLLCIAYTLWHPCLVVWANRCCSEWANKYEGVCNHAWHITWPWDLFPAAHIVGQIGKSWRHSGVADARIYYFISVSSLWPWWLLFKLFIIWALQVVCLILMLNEYRVALVEQNMGSTEGAFRHFTDCPIHTFPTAL